MGNKIRILHVVSGMNRGGAETWLMNILRNIDRSRCQMDFLVQSNENCAYDDEIRELGSKIFPCPRHRSIFAHGESVKKIIRENDPYDVIHSHIHHYSGLILYWAKRAGIKKRIAHSHSDTRRQSSGKGIWRFIYRRLMQGMIDTFATDGMAVSQGAAAALFGEKWQTDSRWKIVYCGIDMRRFRDENNSNEVRSNFQIPMDATVLCHVGNFVEPKNHNFLLRIAQSFLSMRPNTWFLFVGDGPLKNSIQEEAKRLGISDRVAFTGTRSDVHLILKASNGFLFPSLWEGLPLSVVEAQAAGLPCLISSRITQEVCIADNAVNFLDLEVGEQVWAEKMLEVLDRSNIKAVSLPNKFSLEMCINSLCYTYENHHHD